MSGSAEREAAPQTTGKVIHWARGYDLLVWAVSFGRERAYREKAADLAGLKPGEAVLDIGCGTGGLAMAAKGRVGQAGKVCGIDPSPKMIARARKKAQKAGVEVNFQTGVAEALAFADASFDAVLSSRMLHHLPREARRQCAREVRRVLKPGGRLLAIDFGGPRQGRRSLIAHFACHGHFDIRKVIPTLEEAGFKVLESGATGFSDLQYILAACPRGEGSKRE